MLQHFNKTNNLLWLGIILFIIILSGITVYLDSVYYIKPIQNQKLISDLFFVMALILAIGIFIIKRSYFHPIKLVTAVQQESESEKQIKLLNRIRRNYMVVWVMGELIFILGFMQYLLTANFRQFLILGIVGLYSLLINKPNERLLNKCDELLSSEITD
jgi:uncharacterized membrane protein YedE/YeeE